MEDERQEWTIETVPGSFWKRIQEANGDNDRFQSLLADLSQEELRDMYWQYYDLASRLFTPEHLSYLDPDASEDDILDLSTWSVMQGRQYYEDVLNHPEKTPPVSSVRGMDFLSVL